MIVALTAALTLAAATPADDSRARFYSDVTAKKYGKALQDGRPYVSAHPEDARFALDYAYALCNASKTSDARRMLEQLSRSPDASVAGAARAQLAALAPQPRRLSMPVLVSGYVEPDSRYGDTFYGLTIRRDLSAGMIRAFAITDLTSDTRSGAPQSAQVFNTDTLFSGIGLRATPLPGLELRVMGGEGVGLRGQPSMAELRAQASFWRAFGAGNAHSQTSIGTTGVYASRFAGNVVTYTTLQHDMPIVRGVRALVGVNAAADAKALPYNNFIETFAGIQLRAAQGTLIRFDVRHGPQYTAARAMLWFSAGGP